MLKKVFLLQFCVKHLFWYHKKKIHLIPSQERFINKKLFFSLIVIPLSECIFLTFSLRNFLVKGNADKVVMISVPPWFFLLIFCWFAHCAPYLNTFSSPAQCEIVWCLQALVHEPTLYWPCLTHTIAFCFVLTGVTVEVLSFHCWTLPDFDLVSSLFYSGYFSSLAGDRPVHDPGQFMNRECLATGRNYLCSQWTSLRPCEGQSFTDPPAP